MTTPNPVAALLALEIRRILEDLSERQALLVRLWGMHRDRWPMAEAAFSRWRTLRADQLDRLDPDVVVVLDGFYLALEDWLLYVQRTQDMPLHLEQAWAAHTHTLTEAGRAALECLGEPPTAPVPDVDRDGRSFLEAFALVRPGAGSLSQPVVDAPAEE